MTWEIYACKNCGTREPESYIDNHGIRICEYCGSELNLALIDSSEMREGK